MMIGPPCHSNSPSDFIMDTIFSTNFCIAACGKKKKESGTFLPYPHPIGARWKNGKFLFHRYNQKKNSVWVKVKLQAVHNLEGAIVCPEPDARHILEPNRKATEKNRH
jgi:hypothetical protein